MGCVVHAHAIVRSEMRFAAIEGNDWRDVDNEYRNGGSTSATLGECCCTIAGGQYLERNAGCVSLAHVDDSKLHCHRLL